MAFRDISAGNALGAAVIVGSILALADCARLSKAGVGINPLWALFGIPLYLIVRTMKAKSTPAIPVVWFVALLAAFALSNTIGPVAMDSEKVESQIARTIKRELGTEATVVCPADPVVRIDESFICRVHSSNGVVRMTVRVIDRDGRYQARFVR